MFSLLALQAPIELHAADADSGDREAWQVRAATHPLLGESAVLHTWADPDGIATLQLARLAGQLRVSVPESCDFLIDASQRRVEVAAEPDLPASTLEHLLIDQVLPRCLAHDGGLILHAAGVLIDDAAALFLGESGQGKSSLSAALQSLGHSILSDDCLQLETGDDGSTRAWPTYPSLRLLPDMLDTLFPGASEHAPMAGYSDKRRLPVDAVAATADGVPLRAIYLLDPSQGEDEALIIDEVTPAAALLAVTRNLFKLDPTDLARASALLAKAASVIRSTPVFSLRYPRVIAALPAHAAAIAKHAGSARPPAA